MKPYPAFIFWCLTVLALVIANYELEKDPAGRRGWSVVMGWLVLLAAFTYFSSGN